MILEVLEGQTKGGYFSYSIFDPSVNQCNVEGVLARYCGPEEDGDGRKEGVTQGY